MTIVRGWDTPTSYLFFSVVQTISFIYNYSEHKDISYIRSCLYAVFLVERNYHEESYQHQHRR